MKSTELLYKRKVMIVPKSRFFKVDTIPSSVGMVPLMLPPASMKDFILSKFPTSDGIFPVSFVFALSSNMIRILIYYFPSQTILVMEHIAYLIPCIPMQPAFLIQLVLSPSHWHYLKHIQETIKPNQISIA